MAGLPTGTVTFLFTDIEGSTALLQRLGDRRYAEVLAEHQRLLRDAFAKGNGQEIDTQWMPSWWHSPGRETRWGQRLRRNGRSRRIPGRMAHHCGCEWGCIPASDAR